MADIKDVEAVGKAAHDEYFGSKDGADAGQEGQQQEGRPR